MFPSIDAELLINSRLSSILPDIHINHHVFKCDTFASCVGFLRDKGLSLEIANAICICYLPTDQLEFDENFSHLPLAEYLHIIYVRFCELWYNKKLYYLTVISYIIEYFIDENKKPLPDEDFYDFHSKYLKLCSLEITEPFAIFYAYKYTSSYHFNNYDNNFLTSLFNNFILSIKYLVSNDYHINHAISIAHQCKFKSVVKVYLELNNEDFHTQKYFLKVELSKLEYNMLIAFDAELCKGLNYKKALEIAYEIKGFKEYDFL